jgi:hypothetical protein
LLICKEKLGLLEGLVMEIFKERLRCSITRARVAAKSLHDGGKEWRWLELIARAKEGTKELRREGKRGGEDRGLSSPFIGAKGVPGRSGRGGNGGINGFNAIEDGVRLRRGVNEGP